MKMKYHIIYLLAFTLVIASGYSSIPEGDIPATEPGVDHPEEPVEILFGTETVFSLTRADSEFPNEGLIGVVATTEVNSTLWETDWTLYEDIDNAVAQVASETGGGVYL